MFVEHSPSWDSQRRVQWSARTACNYPQGLSSEKLVAASPFLTQVQPKNSCTQDSSVNYATHAHGLFKLALVAHKGLKPGISQWIPHDTPSQKLVVHKDFLEKSRVAKFTVTQCTSTYFISSRSHSHSYPSHDKHHNTLITTHIVITLLLTN